MVFGKPLGQVTFDALERLRVNRIPESDILDYKAMLLGDQDLVKHISAFANTRGGYIIFGVEESGRGGYPVAIPGVDADAVNRERMEQIILSNVQPRIYLGFHQVPHRDPGKTVLILQIPDSQYKPHQNAMNKKYYKRFEFEACEMTELEICEAYKARFSTREEVEGYLDKNYTSILGNVDIPTVISIIPSVLDRRLIDTSDQSKFDWLDSDKIDYEPSGWSWAPKHDFLPGLLKPSAFGLRYSRETGLSLRRAVDIHRNGCIQYLESFGYQRVFGGEPTRRHLNYALLATRIMHTLQFTYDVLLRYNYFGDVRIRVFMDKTMETYMPLTNVYGEVATSHSPNIQVDREVSIGDLKERYSKITASIMNEIFNHYGIWQCYLFDKDGNYARSQFGRT